MNSEAFSNSESDKWTDGLTDRQSSIIHNLYSVSDPLVCDGGLDNKDVVNHVKLFPQGDL